MSNLSIDLLLKAFGKNSQIPYWKLLRIIEDLKESDLIKHDFVYEDYIFDVWEIQMNKRDYCDNNKEITIFMAEYLSLGPKMCDTCSSVGNKYLLSFLHERSFYGENEIVLAVYNSNVDFLTWMYETEIKWDYSLNYLEDIKDCEILNFLKVNMEDWKNNIFPSTYIKPAKKL
jgi:hypothetical protein